MMKYKGYIGVSRVDEEAGVIRGRVVNTLDTITFQGTTVEEARGAFQESVDDYLEFCASLGRTPERPFSGKFLIRVSPTLHRAITAAAHAKGVSVNKLVARRLAGLAGTRGRSTGAVAETARGARGAETQGETTGESAEAP